MASGAAPAHPGGDYKKGAAVSSKQLDAARTKLDELLARARPDLQGACVWSDGTVSLAPRRDVAPDEKPRGLAFPVLVFQRNGHSLHWFVRSCNRKENDGAGEEQRERRV